MTKEDDVRRILTPLREAKLYRSVALAWDDVQVDLPRYSIWPRSRATMMFERLAVRLQEQFADDPAVRFIFADETVKIVFDDRLIVRVKKADNQGLGHNIPTLANDIFCAQGSFLEPLGKVEVVYVLDAFATQIRKVIVQARDGDTRLWSYEIDDSAMASTAPAPLTPLPTPLQPPASPDDLVRPRTTPISKDETDKGK